MELLENLYRSLKLTQSWIISSELLRKRCKKERLTLSTPMNPSLSKARIVLRFILLSLIGRFWAFKQKTVSQIEDCLFTTTIPHLRIALSIFYIQSASCPSKKTPALDAVEPPWFGGRGRGGQRMQLVAKYKSQAVDEWMCLERQSRTQLRQ